MESRNSHFVVYALFAALLATFSFPYLAQADASVNGFFRENLVSSSVFEGHKSFAMDLEFAKARKNKKSLIQKRTQKRNYSIQNISQPQLIKSTSSFNITKASYQLAEPSDSFAID